MGWIQVLILALGLACAGPWAWSSSPFQSKLKIGEIRVSVESEITGSSPDTQAEVLECMTLQLLAAKEFAIEHQALARSWIASRKSLQKVEPFRLAIHVTDRIRGQGRDELWNAEGLTIRLSSPICEALSELQIEALVRARLNPMSGSGKLSDAFIRKPESALSGERRFAAALLSFQKAQR